MQSICRGCGHEARRHYPVGGCAERFCAQRTVDSGRCGCPWVGEQGETAEVETYKCRYGHTFQIDFPEGTAPKKVTCGTHMSTTHYEGCASTHACLQLATRQPKLAAELAAVEV